MSQKRAKVGGEVGINGEYYKGGAFICNTNHAKIARAEKKAATRKIQVGHYEWAVQPTPNAVPLFIGVVGGVFADKFGNSKPLSGVNDAALAYIGITREELASRIERHSKGERWM